jgi:hypothetical protein
MHSEYSPHYPIRLKIIYDLTKKSAELNQHIQSRTRWDKMDLEKYKSEISKIYQSWKIFLIHQLRLVHFGIFGLFHIVDLCILSIPRIGHSPLLLLGRLRRTITGWQFLFQYKQTNWKTSFLTELQMNFHGPTFINVKGIDVSEIDYFLYKTSAQVSTGKLSTYMYISVSDLSIFSLVWTFLGCAV